MDKKSKLLICAASAFFLLALFFGVLRYSNLKGSQEGIPSGHTIQLMDSGWSYVTNTSNIRRITSLPQKLVLPKGTTSLTLTNSLPKTKIFGGVLRLQLLSQQTDIYIDGVHRYSYGDINVSAYDFPYVTAGHLVMLKLGEEDYGKEISIRMRTQPLYQAELSLVHPVEIGSHSDFIMRDLLTNVSGLFVTALSIAFCAVFVCIAVIFIKRGLPVVPVICFLALTLLWIFFYSSDNVLLWEIFHFNPVLSAVNDWKFFVLDSFLPIATFAAFFISIPFQTRKWQRIYFTVYMGMYSAAVLLHLLRAANFNYFRPLFMLLSFILFISTLVQYSRQQKEIENKLCAIAVFIIMTGYYLDYVKYAASLIPVSSKVIVFLQLKLPFCFFLGCSLIPYCMLLLASAIESINRRRMALQVQVDRANLQLAFGQSQYRMMMENYETVRIMRHDMKHHYRTMEGYVRKQNYQQLNEYLHNLTEDAENIQISNWCKSYVANITISNFAGEAARDGIRFHCEANVPDELPESSAELCAVLSNALSNAMEAGRIQKEGDKFVSLLIRPAGDALVISVKNSFSGDVCEKGGKLVTGKEGENHGVGLASIQTIIENRNGFFKITYDKQIFHLEAVLNHVLPVK